MSTPLPDSRSNSNAAAAPIGAAAGLSEREMRGLWIGIGVLTVILVIVFKDFVFRQVQFAIQQQADWGHTLVIPFIAGYFVYLQRRKLLAHPFRTTWIGLGPVVLGVLIYMLCAVGPHAIRHHNLKGFGLSVTLFGLVLLFFGFRAMRYLWFPLLYLCVFGQTISDKLMQYVTYPLQDITARGAEVALALVGQDVTREGNTLTIVQWTDGQRVDKSLNIAEACSGMRMLMAFFALGVAMAFTGLKYAWQRVLLVLLAVPTAIFVNILRVLTLGLLTLVNPDFAAGDFHQFIGLVWLVPAFLIYLGVVWVLKNVVVEESKTTKSKTRKAAPRRAAGVESAS